MKRIAIVFVFCFRRLEHLVLCMRLRRIRSTQSCDFVIQSQVISEVPWQIKTRNWH